MGRPNRHRRMIQSFQDRLNGEGIHLSSEQTARLAAVIREEILHRHLLDRKRINDLRWENQVRDKIGEQIFLTLSRRRGVKMKEVFNLLIPALADIIKIQRCALFSVLEGGERVLLESGYPEAEHGIGTTLSVKELFIDAIVNRNVPPGEFDHETIRDDYIFVKDPQQSKLIPPDLKHFLKERSIHSVLYVPLQVGGVVKHFLTFDSKDQHEGFSDQQVKILSFFGRELMKGLKLERLDEILHDFRNPAIAASWFSRKVKDTLQKGLFPSKADQVYQWLDVLCKETSRIQDLALTLYGEGKEERIDLTERLKKRFIVNTGALRELRRERIRLVEHEPEAPFSVCCFPLHLDRVLDNLLSNATKAVPEEGGEISIRAYRQDGWGVAEIANTGCIEEEEKERFLRADSEGRGLHIATRLVKHMGGTLDVETLEGRTIFRILLPVAP